MSKNCEQAEAREAWRNFLGRFFARQIDESLRLAEGEDAEFFKQRAQEHIEAAKRYLGEAS